MHLPVKRRNNSILLYEAFDYKFITNHKQQLMKKISTLGVLLTILLTFTSCWNNKMSDLMDYVPSDIDYVLVGDVNTVIESAGGNLSDAQINLPSYITDLLGSGDEEQYNEFRNFLKKSGIDITTAAVMGYYKYDAAPILLFSLKDEKQFKKAVEDMDYNEKDSDDGVYVYSKRTYKSDYDSDDDFYSYIVVNGSHAYWTENVRVANRFKPARVIKDIIENAKEKSLNDMKIGSYITEENAGGAVVQIPKELRQKMRKEGFPSEIADLCEGYLCFKGNLTQNNAKVYAKWFDENGNEKDFKTITKYYDTSVKVNPEALKYLCKNEFLVYATALKIKNWDEYFDTWKDMLKENLSGSDRTTLTVIESYLKNLEGTAAIGFGLNNGMDSFFDIQRDNDAILKEMALTIVVETKDGKAQKMIDDIKGLLETQDVPLKSNANGFYVEDPDTKNAIYFEKDNNFIIISNMPVKQYNNNIVSKNIEFDKYISTFAVVLEKKNQLMKGLDVDYGIKFSISIDASNSEIIAAFETEEGSSKGLIEKIIRTMVNLANKDFSDYYEEPTLPEAEEFVDSIAVYEDYDICDTVAYEYDYE